MVNNAANLFNRQIAIIMHATQLANLLIAEEDNAKSRVKCKNVIVFVSFIYHYYGNFCFSQVFAVIINKIARNNL